MYDIHAVRHFRLCTDLDGSVTRQGFGEATARAGGGRWTSTLYVCIYTYIYIYIIHKSLSLYI